MENPSEEIDKKRNDCNYKYPFVILVDDNKTDLFLLEKILSVKNLTQKITKYFSASEALEYLVSAGAKIPDLIFLDLCMPEMDGFEFLERVRKIEVFKGKIKVVIVSSSDDAHDMKRAHSFKMVKHYLLKPVAIELLEIL